MSLFQQTIVARHLQSQDKEQLAHKWNTYKNHFLHPEIQENIRNSKEEQYQGEFLIDLFVNVLGYVKSPNPNFNLITEQKNAKGAKKADGAILLNGSVKVGWIQVTNAKFLTYIVRQNMITNEQAFPQILMTDLQLLKIPSITLSEQQPFIEKADQMLALNKDLQELSAKFQRTLKREFELDELSKKLASWHDLEYADFLKELKKKKVTLSLAQKSEWEDYFLAEQQKALTLKNQIATTDNEIDETVA